MELLHIYVKVKDASTYLANLDTQSYGNQDVSIFYDVFIMYSTENMWVEIE